MLVSAGGTQEGVREMGCYTFDLEHWKVDILFLGAFGKLFLIEIH